MYGSGKIAVFGDSNGFTAMVFNMDDGTKMYAGMNTEEIYFLNLKLFPHQEITYTEIVMMLLKNTVKTLLL